ncbi:MAG: S-methyl-5'-thioadenosine phosphorylase [Nitrospirota bacterium]|nr:MAG: S-methyl-5'-thioadenosine phosphorylase [Nitrospirota bacterium]
MKKKPYADIAIIGGSGLYELQGLERIRRVRRTTPFGQPSDEIILGNLGESVVAFLARHGRGHRIPPTAINYRANIYALKALGVKRIFSVSAVGSMKESIKPGDLALPDQFIDRTTMQRKRTFFDRGVVAHIPFSDPICSIVSNVLWQASQEVGATVHRPGTYVCIEGPQFSTRAESHLYRQWNADVIGMTNIPEANLAREAEICYATLALVTDFDCWHQTEEAVSVEAIITIMKQNVEVAKRVLRYALDLAQGLPTCSCHSALQNAVITAPEAITPTLRNRYRVLLQHYLPPKKTKKGSS